ncbi:HNH endonuclease signature motif containing protein [Mycolicibacterium elephantis]|uniref:HNH endonuclease n=1 Tax=Mycolicibacterium elephantis TaxID=81858 RepID=UPI003A876F32
MSLEVETVLSQLLLEQEYDISYGKILREWALERLRMEDELNNHIDQYVKLRVALSLCPVSALTHRKSERLSRSEKILEHILNEKLATKEDAPRIARIVDKVIDSWLTERESVAGYKDALMERDGTCCNACHVDLAKPPAEAVSVSSRDPYKLTWLAPERTLSYTVDHKVPVSKFGTNELSNLELLCRYCNEGKDDGSPLLLKHEVELAARLPAKGDCVEAGLLVKSARLVYRVLKRDKFTCVRCAALDGELTVRKVSGSGLAVMSNLQAVCYGCVEAELTS